MTLYGIPNCNTVKKATDWLKENKVAYAFHDYKKLGIDSPTLESWTHQIGWEVLLNKKGTTWRALDEATQNSVTTTKKAIELMVEKPSMIKRPVIVNNSKIIAIGFDAVKYREAFADFIK